jgi:O-glycosyl hydrolase
LFLTVRADLPAFFERTLELTDALPQNGRLEWIFTGPHAGFTVYLSATQVELQQRYYDSIGLSSGANYPSRVTEDEKRNYAGTAKSLTVLVDAHLAIHVLLNGSLILTERCVFDVTRHQLKLDAPRTMHEIVSGRLLREDPLPVTLSIDAGKPHQTMLGFGGSASIPGYASLSDEGKRQYWELLRHYNLLIDREYPMGTELKRDLSNMDNLADATPHYYGDNFPNGEVSDFDYGRRTLDMGGSVIYEMWALPRWATVAWQPDPGSPPLFDAWKKPVSRAADPETYASIVVDYCKRLKEHTGSPPQIVGIENEVEQPLEVFAKMTTVLRSELDRAGFTTTRIHMADAPYVSMAINRVNALKADPAAWSATDYVTAHQYDYQHFLSDPDQFDAPLRALHEASAGKPFLATEICLNDKNAQEPSYRLAFQVAQLYHKDLTLLDAEALLYCWLLLDVEEPTFGGSRSLLVPDRTNGNVPVASSFQLRVLGAWSRHITRGMTRVEISSDDPDVLTTAFTQGSHATLIVMNRATGERVLHIAGPGSPVWKQMERTSLYLANASATMKSNQEVAIAPGEIVTLSTDVAP